MIIFGSRHPLECLDRTDFSKCFTFSKTETFPECLQLRVQAALSVVADLIE